VRLEVEAEVEKFIPYVGYFLAVLFIVIGIPLALKLIGPNAWYGVRLTSTMENPDTWYAVNSLAGWCMVVAGGISLAIVFMAQNHWELDFITKIVVVVFTPAILAVIAMVIAIIKASNQ
jgi:glucose-6-phosphate-specific signal transduction histidine kinase